MSKVFKFNEESLIDELREYIGSTYGQHYVGDIGGKNNAEALQIQELFHSIGIAVPFCQANAIKYLSRYGRKGGKNRKDILKALHYSILLLFFEDDIESNNQDQCEFEFFIDR
tara:strand:+ start:90 stop:428 length:339 start_codon:yes stop_codon:yes gene_type:complete